MRVGVHGFGRTASTEARSVEQGHHRFAATPRRATAPDPRLCRRNTSVVSSRAEVDCTDQLVTSSALRAGVEEGAAKAGGCLRARARAGRGVAGRTAPPNPRRA